MGINRGRWKRYVVAAAVGATVVASATVGLPAHAATSGASGSGPVAQPPVIMWQQGQASPIAGPTTPTQAVNNLIFHGGAVQHNPKAYIVFWGTEWKNGFTTSDANGVTFTGDAARRYITDFMAGVGGSAWNGTQTQYCDNIAPGSDSCAGEALAQPITNPKNLLKGVWIDPTPVPAQIVTSGLAENVTNDPIAAEALKASQHFGYDVDATYFVMTPPGHAATAYGSVYCAYHSEVTNVGGHGIRYAFIPYVMEQGAGCAQYGVNPKPDAYGHGFFDSYSIVVGHEFAEAETDPDSYPFQDGWNDAQTSENGDKCAYFEMANITLGKKYFAVQPLWSNEANNGEGGCTMKRGTGPADVKPPV